MPCYEQALKAYNKAQGTSKKHLKRSSFRRLLGDSSTPKRRPGRKNSVYNEATRLSKGELEHAENIVASVYLEQKACCEALGAAKVTVLKKR